MTDEPIQERSLLEHISTHWTAIADPAQFVLRYAPAIRSYLFVLMRGTGDTDDVTQEFLTRVLTRGFSEVQITRGRFRDYLRVAVRNAAMDHFRRQPLNTVSDAVLESFGEPDETSWINEWRACVLEKTLRQLELYERQTPGNLYATVLRTTIDHPEETSNQLADRASKIAGQTISATAYRQQLHRARQKLAEILVEEVRQTLRNPTRELVLDELREVGLFAYVEDYLAHVIP